MDNLSMNLHDIDVDDISMKYLTCHVSDQTYAFPIKYVISIIKAGSESITPVPEFPYYAKGIINLRGKVTPVIDVNLRFDKPQKDYTDRTCIIIVSVDDVNQTGFIVDAVDAVTDILEENISPPPVFKNDMSHKYVKGIGKNNKKMVLILNTGMLISDSNVDFTE